MRDIGLDAVGQDIRIGDKVAAIRKGGRIRVGRITSFTSESARVDIGSSTQVFRDYLLVKTEDQS